MRDDFKESGFDGGILTHVNGMPQLNHMKKDSYYFGSDWCEYVLDMIANDMESNWNFADIGSHCGQFAIVAAKRTTGTVYCFEPDSEPYECLKINAKRFDNMETYNIVLSDNNCEIGFTKDGTGSSHVGGDVMVECRTLDSYGFDIQMMNIDVEGHGCEMLLGAEETLNNTNIVIFETHKGEDTAEKILESFGFLTAAALGSQLVGTR